MFNTISEKAIQIPQTDGRFKIRLSDSLRRWISYCGYIRDGPWGRLHTDMPEASFVTLHVRSLHNTKRTSLTLNVGRCRLLYGHSSTIGYLAITLLVRLRSSRLAFSLTNRSNLHVRFVFSLFHRLVTRLTWSFIYASGSVTLSYNSNFRANRLHFAVDNRSNSVRCEFGQQMLQGLIESSTPVVALCNLAMLFVTSQKPKRILSSCWSELSKWLLDVDIKQMAAP